MSEIEQDLISKQRFEWLAAVIQYGSKNLTGHQKASSKLHALAFRARVLLGADYGFIQKKLGISKNQYGSMLMRKKHSIKWRLREQGLMNWEGDWLV